MHPALRDFWSKRAELKQQKQNECQAEVNRHRLALDAISDKYDILETAALRDYFSLVQTEPSLVVETGGAKNSLASSKNVSGQLRGQLYPASTELQDYVGDNESIISDDGRRPDLSGTL
jgi:hypothetical protein